MALEHDDRAKEEMVRAAKVMQEKHTGLVLTGTIRDGKLEIDQASLEEAAKKFPKGNISFIAMNSPFDPNSQSL
jgi:hypothetical protein